MKAREFNKLFNGEEVKRSDRIKYQLYKQKMNIYSLYRKRDADGEDYKNEKMMDDLTVYELASVRNNASYISKQNDMPEDAYRELCKRLRIEVEIEEPERYAIRQWLEFVEKYKKKKLKNKEIEEKQEFVAEAEKSVPKYIMEHYDKEYIYGQELIEETKKKKWFLNYAKELPHEVLKIWYEYAELYNCELFSELQFISLYSQVNELGRKIFHETILQCFEEQDYLYEDERTELYRSLGNENLSNVDLKMDLKMLEEIYELWATSYIYDADYIVLIKELTDKMVEFTKDDWQCIIDYHRIRMTGTEIEIDDKPFLDYLEKTFYIIAGIPSFS